MENHDDEELQERRRHDRLDSEQFEDYYTRFRERIYAEIGKKVINGVGWLVSTGAIVAFLWVIGKGSVPFSTILKAVFE